MKSKGLLSVLTYSEKRKDILFLLDEGPKTLSDIKSYFNVTSPEILPRIKEMEASNLIFKDDKRYYISPIGKGAASYLRPLIQYLKAVEKYEQFWKEHIIDDIPQELLERLSDLDNCKLFQDKIENIYESHTHFTDNIQNSTKVMGLTSIFIPTYPEFFTQLVNAGIPTSLILTQNVFGKVFAEYQDETRAFLSADNTELYVIEDAKLAFVTTDYFFSMSLFYKNGTYDPQKDLVGHDKTALKWGEDLFNHYKAQAKEIKGF
jgi:predicted transcriptional regulator